MKVMREAMEKRFEFLVPREGERQKRALSEYVRRLWVEGTVEQVEDLFLRGKVQVNGVMATRPEKAFDGGDRVVVEVDREGEEIFGLPDAEALLWGEGWVVVEKPVGIPGRLRGDDPMDPLRFMADLLGMDREWVRPVWEVPAGGGGPWLLAVGDETARELSAKIGEGELSSIWQALILRPPQGQGRFQTEEGEVEYAVIRTEGVVAEVQLIPKWKGGAEVGAELVDQLLKMMAAAGYPVLGDGVNGGYLVAGGLRLRLGALYGVEPFAHSWPSPRQWWPEEEILEPSEEEEETEEKDASPGAGRRERSSGGGRRRTVEVKELQISRQSFEILKRRGHPWVLRDRETGSLEGISPGEPVRLVVGGRKGELFGVVDGTGDVVARFWSEEEEEAREFFDEVEIRLDEAMGVRGERFREMAKTDVFRIVHGEADGLPGIWVDRLGSVFRITSLGRCAGGYREWITRLLVARDETAMVLHVDHTRDLRRRETLPEAEILHEGGRYVRPGQELIVREEGLKYLVEPWEGVDVGFFADQRDNRRIAAELAEKQSGGEGEEKEQPKWLNLFCHTGAFSVALAKAGAATTNVDLSRRYLRWLDRNFELNGLELESRVNVDEDARRYLGRTKEVFEGIIVDPPTASSGEAGFWSVRDDYLALLVQCFEVLVEEGVMLVCRNEKRPREGLEMLVRKAAKQAGWKISRIEEAPPGSDYPSLQGFPEGDKFEGVWVFGA